MWVSIVVIKAATANVTSTLHQGELLLPALSCHCMTPPVMSAVSHRHLVVERVLMSVLSLSLAYLVKEPIARHAACLVLLLGFAAVLMFTNCCSVPAFARSRAVAVLVASWSLATNLGQYYGLHDSYAVVFLSGAFIIIVISVLIAVAMVLYASAAQGQSTTLEASYSDVMFNPMHDPSQRVMLRLPRVTQLPSARAMFGDASTRFDTTPVTTAASTSPRK
jgi:hypothetical protein